MIHKLTLGGDELLVHHFHFAYQTGESEGMPSQYGSSGRLSISVEESGKDADGKNFKTSRDALWKRCVGAPTSTQADLKEEITLVIAQDASGQGSRKVVFRGWVMGVTEESATDGQATLSGEIYVWPADAEGYMPGLEGP